jgi:hypothetical protein
MSRGLLKMLRKLSQESSSNIEKTHKDREFLAEATGGKTIDDAFKSENFIY